jgi:hypothetical protein
MFTIVFRPTFAAQHSRHRPGARPRANHTASVVRSGSHESGPLIPSIKLSLHVTDLSPDTIQVILKVRTSGHPIGRLISFLLGSLLGANWPHETEHQPAQRASCHNRRHTKQKQRDRGQYSRIVSGHRQDPQHDCHQTRWHLDAGDEAGSIRRFHPRQCACKASNPEKCTPIATSVTSIDLSTHMERTNSTAPCTQNGTFGFETVPMLRQ